MNVPDAEGNRVITNPKATGVSSFRLFFTFIVKLTLTLRFPLLSFCATFV